MPPILQKPDSPEQDSNNFAQTLEDLYAHLSPTGVDNKLVLQRSVNIKSISQIIKEQILGNSGDVYSWEHLKSQVDNYFKGKNKEAIKEEQKDLSIRFHAISTTGVLNLGDQEYWGEETKNLTNFVSSLNSSLSKHKNCVVSAYVSRDPYISPATRGSQDVEIFLNYMPSIAVSQMVPFLETEFELLGQIYTKENARFITTPSYMRFLLGSENRGNLNEFDKILLDADIVDRQKVTNKIKGKEIAQGRRNVMRSGVEMFLMPQSLTNMDNLAPGNNRLVRARPFVPYASIEGFDVSIMNAGAGSMVHKTGTLKLKIHDKSRLSEFSEFIRGPSGYASAVIWTRYGWSAPVGRDDAYLNFINQKLYSEDCWMVQDAQFSFDAGGQVTLTLKLVSKGVKEIQNLMISSGENSMSDALNRLKKTIDTIFYYYDSLKRNNSFSTDVTISQVMNVASTTGNIGDFKNIDVITQKIRAISERSGLSSIAAEELKQELDKLISKDDNVYVNYVNSIPQAVKQKFDKLSIGTDPFLPPQVRLGNDVKKEKNAESVYFPDEDLASAIIEFKTDLPNRDAEIAKQISNLESERANKRGGEPVEVVKPIPLISEVSVVSFGKLFMNFVASALVTLEEVDELQFFFYPMNDFSGPMSGYSIAEFPIDTTALAYTYAEELKRIGTDQLTLQQFLRLVIESQFSDVRAIGYGRNSFYKYFSVGKKTKAELKDAEGIQSRDAKWSEKYGGWRPPLIDFYIETGEYQVEKDGTRSFKTRKHRAPNDNIKKSGQLIKRFHIFDRQLNPYRLAQSILSGDSGYERGDVNRGKLRGRMQNIVVNSKEKEKFQKFVEDVNRSYLDLDRKAEEERKLATTEEQRRIIQLRTDKAKVEALRTLSKGTVEVVDRSEVVDRPGRSDYKIKFEGNKRELIKAELMRFVPTLTPGTNGSLIQSINAGSKTDGTMGAANLYKVVKGGSGKNALTLNGLEEFNELPLRSVPMQLTMSTLGCPNASLYQDFFIDMNTGTTVDNLYKCTQMQHQISAGRFITNWTFAFTDGYGKFGSPPTIDGIISGEYKSQLNKITNDKK